jgi:dipeptidyl-peptidase-3
MIPSNQEKHWHIALQLFSLALISQT